MKKKGILIACLALSMTITVSAFTYKKVSANLKSQAINYKGNISNQEVLVYNNTTYVPLRNLSELVGIPLEYKDGVIYLGEYTNDTDDIINNDSNNNSQGINHNGNRLYIGKQEAKNIALKHAGMQKGNFTITKLKLSRHDNRIVYEVEFFAGNKEYDYDIDAITGQIVSYDHDIEGFEIPNTNSNANYIGEEKAEQIALAHANLTKQQVSYVKNELDQDDGIWEYQIEFKYENKEYEYDINAYTGEIIDYSIDND